MANSDIHVLQVTVRELSDVPTNLVKEGKPVFVLFEVSALTRTYIVYILLCMHHMTV